MRCTNNRYRRQQGATAVFVAIALVPLLIATMLAIEVGRVYYAHRSLQKAANLAALDAARVIGGCGNTELPTETSLRSAVQDSLARNGVASLYTNSVVEAGRITTDTDEGTGTGIVRYLVPVDLTDAVEMERAFGARVTLTQPFPTPLLPLFSSNAREMGASATAEQPVLGSLRIGSGVASLNKGVLNSLLSALLGGNINLSVADYNGLADVNLTVGQLATSLGLSVKDLSSVASIEAHTPVLSAVLSNLVGTLGSAVSAQVANSLQSLAGQATNNTPIPLGTILQPVGDIASNVPFINLRDVILALAMASRADPSGNPTPIELKNLDLTVPGVANVNVYLKVIEPARPSVLGRAGQTSAQTAQIRLMVRIQAGTLLNGLKDLVNNVVNGLVSGLLSIVGALIGTPSVSVTLLPSALNIGIDLVVAPAKATLDVIECPTSGQNNGYPIAGLSGQTAAATLQTGTFSGSSSTATELSSSATSWDLVRITVDQSHSCFLLLFCSNYGKDTVTLGLKLTTLGIGQTSKTLADVEQFTRITNLPVGSSPTWLANGSGSPADATPNDNNPQTFGSTANLSLSLGLVADKSDSTSTFTGTLLGLVTKIVNGVNPLVQNLLNIVNGLVSNLVTPLLNALGIQLGTATVTMQAVTISQPVIVSTALPGANVAP